MYNKTIQTIIVAIAAIGMLSGIAAGMNTNVVYNGDGQYDCNYNGYGTGYVGIYTYTSDGSDLLMSGWENSEAHGWQSMDTTSGTGAYGGNYSGTAIARSVTVGGANAGGDESGYIVTITMDNDNNSVYTEAIYRDNVGAGSHVTTDQIVAVGSVVNIGNSSYNVTGVVAATKIGGYSYGRNTTVSGFVLTRSGDAYTYVLLEMDNGRMDLYVLSGAGSVDPAYGPYEGACGQLVRVDANGVGTFAAGAGTDMHGAGFRLIDDDGTFNLQSYGTNVTMHMETTFDGSFDGFGYIYAVDLT